MKQALNKVIAGDFESMYVKNSLLGPCSAPNNLDNYWGHFYWQN